MRFAARRTHPVSSLRRGCLGMMLVLLNAPEVSCSDSLEFAAKTTVAMKGERRQWHRRLRDGRCLTMGSNFEAIRLTVAEIWVLASAAQGGGSILSRSVDLRSAAQFSTTPFLSWSEF